MVQELLNILACPKCHGGLENRENELLCSICKLAFPVEEEIPIMLIEKARPLQ